MLLILLILFTVVFKTSAKALSHKENPLNDTCMSMSYWIVSANLYCIFLLLQSSGNFFSAHPFDSANVGDHLLMSVYTEF
jgi:hypothetical protein